jgi:hypothetical protein
LAARALQPAVLLTMLQTYTVLDGDIIFFKFNAGAGLTKGKK